MPAVQETWVQSLGWEDPLEKKMTTHSSILDWKIPWTEEPGRPQSMGYKESYMTEQLSTAQEVGITLQTWRKKTEAGSSFKVRL